MTTKNKRAKKSKLSNPNGIIFIFTGVCFIIIASLATPWLNNLQAETTTWPSVEGKIVVSEVISRYDPLELEPDEQWEYMVDIVYQYTVGAHAYNDSDIYYRAGLGSEWGTEVQNSEWALLARYPVNSTVTVYYDPDDPDESCLIPGINPGNQTTHNVILAVGGFTIAMGIILCFWDNCRNKQPKELPTL